MTLIVGYLITEAISMSFIRAFSNNKCRLRILLQSFIFQMQGRRSLSSSGMGDNELEILETPGVPHFDWFIKFKIEDREPTYKLQHFATKYCGRGKDDMHYSEIPILANGTPKDRARLVKYCIMDCTLLDDLEKKRNIFNDLFSLSNVCLILPQWVYFKGQQVDTLHS